MARWVELLLSLSQIPLKYKNFIILVVPTTTTHLVTRHYQHLLQDLYLCHVWLIHLHGYIGQFLLSSNLIFTLRPKELQILTRNRAAVLRWLLACSIKWLTELSSRAHLRSVFRVVRKCLGSSWLDRAPSWKFRQTHTSYEVLVRHLLHSRPPEADAEPKLQRSLEAMDFWVDTDNLIRT